MLATGAGGDTHSQMFSALGYAAPSMTQAEVNEAYEHLVHMLGHQRDAQQLDVGNAVALRQGFKAAEKFLADVKHYYAGEAFDVDFANEAGAVAQINSFIAKKTQDKITDLLTSLDPETSMVLNNYVFFRGRRRITGVRVRQTHKCRRTQQDLIDCLCCCCCCCCCV